VRVCACVRCWTWETGTLRAPGATRFIWRRGRADSGSRRRVWFGRVGGGVRGQRQRAEGRGQRAEGRGCPAQKPRRRLVWRAETGGVGRWLGGGTTVGFPRRLDDKIKLPRSSPRAPTVLACTSALPMGYSSSRHFSERWTRLPGTSFTWPARRERGAVGDSLAISAAQKSQHNNWPATGNAQGAAGRGRSSE